MTDAQPVVWLAGVTWDAVPGTDRRLVEALAEQGPVIWVDAPARGHWRGWWSRSEPAVSEVAPGIRRVRTPALPGFSRFPVRMVTGLIQRATVRRNLATAPSMVIVANPVTRFPGRVSGTRVLFITDDWIAGAGLMGYSQRWLRGIVESNVRAAGAVAAVTPALLRAMIALVPDSDAVAAVVPNGAPVVSRPEGIARQPVAGVVGQLNERLDLSMLEAVSDAGVRLRLIGPRTEHDPDFAKRLDALVAREGVEWVGPVAPEALPAHLAVLGVGLTPYADSAFNRASFPLKTLEYLAAGLPVVSTDLPASRWLGEDQMTIAGDAAAFVAATKDALHAVENGTETAQTIDARIDFAAAHGWDRRAAQIRALAEASA